VCKKGVIFVGKRVLVVDDSAVNREIMKDYLEDIGCSACTVESGEKAYMIIKDICESDTSQDSSAYDIILMDIRMPGMDGCDTTRKIREIGAEYSDKLRIVAMTASSDEADMLRAKESGMNGYILKPVEMITLKEIMAS